jgi:hypothetical protein
VSGRNISIYAVAGGSPLATDFFGGDVAGFEEVGDGAPGDAEELGGLGGVAEIEGHRWDTTWVHLAGCYARQVGLASLEGLTTTN